MFRLAFWAMIFGAGVYFGVKLSEQNHTNKCLDAGGAVSEQGLCLGL